MKFNCDVVKQWHERRMQKQVVTFRAAMEWHKIFTVFPVKVGPGDCRMCETVERRVIIYNYRNGRILTNEASDFQIKSSIITKAFDLEYRAVEKQGEN